ncbi:hypothetical protein HAX54_043433 [Datura stramonium]|uniref:Uncharacterized protein n=1 Tax=Datura stramonium TaxID=4076 RepID=A0ABS8W0Z0_DATST|nr:hypothetical protein [Datura stramonium]
MVVRTLLQQIRRFLSRFIMEKLRTLPRSRCNGNLIAVVVPCAASGSSAKGRGNSLAEAARRADAVNFAAALADRNRQNRKEYALRGGL